MNLQVDTVSSGGIQYCHILLKIITNSYDMKKGMVYFINLPKIKKGRFGLCELQFLFLNYLESPRHSVHSSDIRLIPKVVKRRSTWHF